MLAISQFNNAMAVAYFCQSTAPILTLFGPSQSLFFSTYRDMFFDPPKLSLETLYCFVKETNPNVDKAKSANLHSREGERKRESERECEVFQCI